MRTPRESLGLWRASLRADDDWRAVRAARGPYATASMLEWGSITKGLVGTTAWLTLEVERPVSHYLPDVPDAEMTVADLVHHTSGLPRLPATMRDRLLGDPYREAVGVPLDHAVAVPVAPRGQFVYSNLGIRAPRRSARRGARRLVRCCAPARPRASGDQLCGPRARSGRSRGAEALRSCDQAVGARRIVVRGCRRRLVHVRGSLSLRRLGARALCWVLPHGELAAGRSIDLDQRRSASGRSGHRQRGRSHRRGPHAREASPCGRHDRYRAHRAGGPVDT